jgi:phenylacetate-CoA ligase
MSGLGESLRFALDAWRVGRAGMPAVDARQRARLAELVAFARERSPYYREHYKALPSQTSDLRLLPPVSKPELMDNFDGWVTDPAVTRAGVEAFVADLSLIGHECLGRYMVWTTSGTTGTPAIPRAPKRHYSARFGPDIPAKSTLGASLIPLLRHFQETV